MAKKMMDKLIFFELREELLKRRDELIDRRHTLNDAWQRLHEPETELEETASKATLSSEMQQRLETLQTEIGNIDIALGRMVQGGYGRCEACRRPIRVKRLQALPWARHCVKCARMREHLPDRGTDATSIARGHGVMTDDEMREAIMEEVAVDGRVETEELVISSEDGVVYLEGFLPSHTKREILLEIVHDVLETGDVVDSIRIDRQPWEREARRPDSGQPGQPAAFLVGEEEDADGDPFTSHETGEPMAPPDERIPERAER
jgi:DnaK suppressor protein